MNLPISTNVTNVSSGCHVINEFDTAKYNCEPEFKLPTLMERSTKSKIEHLFEVSMQLMPSDDEETGYISENESNTRKSLKNLKSSGQVVKDLKKNKVALEMQKKKKKQIKRPKKDHSRRLSEDLENAKGHDRKYLRLDTSSISAIKNFKLSTKAELLTAKRNLKVLKRKRPKQTTQCWGRYKKFRLRKIQERKSTQTFLACQHENDKWIWCSLIILLCSIACTSYITRFDICDWHIKVAFYDSLKQDCNFIMKWYYSFRIWLIKP